MPGGSWVAISGGFRVPLRVLWGSIGFRVWGLG